MTQHNVGALVVVKPEQEKSIAGIITERGICTNILKEYEIIGFFFFNLNLSYK